MIDVLRFLTPYEIDKGKVRVGPEFDGGYVLADCIDSIDSVFSYGIGSNVGFDLSFAQKGVRVHMYDHTISTLPTEHQNFDFHREGIGPIEIPEVPIGTLEKHMMNAEVLSDRNILKIDIEGAEWDVLSVVSEELLSKFEQILIEVHMLTYLEHASHNEKMFRALQKLTRTFTLFHVHANNWSPLAFVGGFPVVDVLELSFIRSNLVSRSPNQTIFPTRYDGVNRPDVRDYILSFFPFMPNSTVAAELEVLANLNELEFIKRRR